MKVLKEGKKPKIWAKKVTCTGKGNYSKGCRAKLLVTAKDLYQTFKSTDGETTTTFVTFQCPLCKAETDIGTYADIPSEVQKETNKHKKSKMNIQSM